MNDENAPELPEVISRRPLHFFWLTDHSGSMSGSKIASLNHAIRESVAAVQSAVAEHPHVNVMMRAISFSSEARWHVGPIPVPLEQFQWPDLSAEGLTATEDAINLLCDELAAENMPSRGFPPVCLLISDGYANDPNAYAESIARLNTLPWGRKAIRLAVAVGEERDYDDEQLSKFISPNDVKLIKATGPSALVQYIKWASVAASVSSARSRSKSGVEVDSPVQMSSAPKLSDDDDLF